MHSRLRTVYLQQGSLQERCAACVHELQAVTTSTGLPRRGQSWTGGSRRLTLPVDRERIDTAAGRICQEYGMRKRQKPVKIYDAFMFNSELDMLEVHAALLALVRRAACM